MQFKISLKRLLLIIGIAVVFSIIILFLTFNSSSFGFYAELTSSTNNQTLQQTNLELPVRLKIPEIGIDSTVEYVGFTSDGAMDVPKIPADVAWFNLGPRPGENGSAVISGHFGWKDNIPAVFDNLHKLQKGDKVYIEGGGEVTTIFVVREVRTYGENEDASDVFVSNDGKSHLNLITCEGVWDKAKESYSKRLVVFTDKE